MRHLSEICIPHQSLTFLLRRINRLMRCQITRPFDKTYSWGWVQADRTFGLLLNERDIHYCIATLEHEKI